MHITHFNPNSLLKINPEVELHYSTPLIVETLNTYLLNAVEEAFYNSAFMKAQFMCLIGVYHTDTRKQIASSNFNTVQTAFVSALCDRSEFYRVRELFMDRSVTYSQINGFVKEIDSIVELYVNSIRYPSIPNLEKYQDAKNRLGLLEDPINLRNKIYFWLSLYVEFRNSIINNYIKFSFIKSMGVASTLDTFVDHNELYMNYLLAVNRAIDKCDKSKGALTSYIMQWFMNANSHPEFPHEYGVSYYLPNNQKIKRVGDKELVARSNNFSESLHSESIQDELDVIEAPIPDFDENNMDHHLLKKLSKIKEVHLAYMSVGLPIYLTNSQKSRLKATKTR